MAALAAGVLLTGNSTLRAQDTTNTPPTGMKTRGNAFKELNLTDDQKPKVQAIVKDSREKLKAVREDSSLTPEEKKAKVKEIQQDQATQLKAVLTPDQFTKWQEISKKHHNGPSAATPPAN